jgi:hypothetical protein
MSTEETGKNVDVKQAVNIARVYLIALYPEAKNIRLEEVELLNGEWNVVLSFPSDDPLTSSFSAMLLSSQETIPRLYKLVRINKAGGEAVALKVWKP